MKDQTYFSYKTLIDWHDLVRLVMMLSGGFAAFLINLPLWMNGSPMDFTGLNTAVFVVTIAALIMLCITCIYFFIKLKKLIAAHPQNPVKKTDAK